MTARILIVGSATLLVLTGAVYLLRSPTDADVPTVAPVSVPAPEAAAGSGARPAPGSATTPSGPPGDGSAAPAPGAAAPSSGEAPDSDAATGSAVDSGPVGGDPEPSGPGASQDTMQASVLRAASRAYEGVHSIRATFEQELENTLLGRTTTSRGTIYQRQPDLFRMAFSDPAGDLIVSDGQYFWTWYPSVDSTQVIRMARTATGLDLRSQFIGDPVDRFEVSYHGTEAVGGRPTHVMTLVPRQAAGFARLKVWIDDADHLVRRFELTESNGNVRHFRLSDLAVNAPLPDTLFQFTPPPGARVVTR